MSLLSIEELKRLVEPSQAPCISLYMPTYQAGPEVRQNPIRFKNVIRQAEELLKEHYQLEVGEATALLQPALDLDENDFWQHQDQGLAIFCAKDFFHYYQLPLEFEELVVVSDRFHLKPLMPLLTGDGKFYLLALSQKQIRFFEGTRYSLQEIELVEDVPTNMDDALLYDETAKEGQFRISTSKGGTDNPFPQVGSAHGQGSPDRDKPQRHGILQFFHQLDQSLREHYLHDEHAPLLTAGVDYLLPLYQEANSYPYLVDEIISIENVGVMEPDEAVHHQAWSIVEPYYTQAQEQAVDRYHELAATGAASAELNEIVAAAYYGRVDQLFVPLNTQQWGTFDPQTNQLQIHDEAKPGDEDLLNAAAVQTLTHGGTVYAVEAEAVPDSQLMAAIFRY